MDIDTLYAALPFGATIQQAAYLYRMSIDAITKETIKSIYPGFETGLIEEIIAEGLVKTYPEGAELMRPGQNIRSTLLLIEGLIKVFREDDEGHEIFMYYLEPGHACALSIICAAQQQTSAIRAEAVKESSVLAIPIQFIDTWMKRYPSWYQFVLSTYRNRFEELLNTLDAVAFRKMDERLVLYLNRQQQISGSANIAVTHAQIATELNTSREVITRLLKKLAEKGLIRVNRHSIELTGLDKQPM